MIITEKPDAARHVAEALQLKGKPKRLNIGGVPIFEVKRDDERILVCSAIGHMYEVDEKIGSDRSQYPVWDFAWKPRHLVERGQLRLEKWLKTISEIAKEADEFYNATDFDIEGSVIGYMILRYACGGVDKQAKRMKFSTLTAKELREAYRNPLPQLDYPLIHAGMCRHETDFIYGVNLSRALTQSAHKYSGRYATISTGRVQGPTLRFVVEKEKDIATFVPAPYWVIRATVNVDGTLVEAEFQRDKVESRREAEAVVQACRGAEGLVTDIESKRYRLAPPVPFDLSTLQSEAYRHFGITPMASLGIAERLYLDALISYPRTSSQKLPAAIDYRGILEGLSKDPIYGPKAKLLMSLPALKPNEGKREDPAHPAVYPTGNLPSRKLEAREQKIFDLVIKRFFATFGPAAIKQSDRAELKVDGHTFYLRGSRLIEPGWTTLYEPYAKLEEVTLPPIQVAQRVKFVEVKADEKFTQPPPRYNPSSLLKLMESQGIGTKATRAEIIDVLYRRGYIRGERIVATPLAFNVTELLLKYCPKVIDVKFTRELEEMMEAIELGKGTREDVILEAVEHLKPIMEELKLKEKEIGRELTATIKGMLMSAITLKSPCPKCGSKLYVIRSRRSGKRFIGCSGKWSGGCGFALPLPQAGTLALLDKLCENCGFQIVQVRVKGRRPLTSCPLCFASSKRTADHSRP